MKNFRSLGRRPNDNKNNFYPSEQMCGHFVSDRSLLPNKQIRTYILLGEALIFSAALPSIQTASCCPKSTVTRKDSIEANS